MSTFLSQSLQATTAANTSSVISPENSSDGVPLSDPSPGLINYDGVYVSGANYSVIQIAIRSDTICTISIISAFDTVSAGFVSDSHAVTAGEAAGVAPVTLYYYISCPFVKVQVVNSQAGNTVFQLSTKLTSASPPVTATATSGDTYTAVDGIPYLNTYIGGQTIIINPTSTVNANIVDQTYTTYQGKSFLNCYIEQENVTISGVNVVSSQLAVVDASGNASLASIDGKIVACNTGAAVLAGVNIVSSQLSVRDASGNASLASIDGKIVACNTGAAVLAGVNIVSSQLSVRDASGNSSLASLDSKTVVCDTSAAVLAGVAIDRSQLTVYDADCHAHLSTINTGINKASTFTDAGAVGLKVEGSVGVSYDLGTIQNRYINATFMGTCDTTTYASPNFIFQYSFNNTNWFSDGVEPSFYVDGTSSSFVFQRASCPSRYVRLLFISDTFLSSLQIVFVCFLFG